MPAKLDDPRPETTDHFDDGNLLKKINLTFPEGDNERRCEWWLNSCDLKTLLGRVGVLLAFHLVNVGVMIVGVVAIALLIAGLLLNCCWLVVLVVVAILWVPFHLLFQLPYRQRCWMYLGFLGFVALYLTLLVMSFVYVYPTYTPYTVTLALSIGGGVGLVLCYLVLQLVIVLIRTEIQLVNFVSPSLSCCSAPENNLMPDECVKRFESECFREYIFGSRNRTPYLTLPSMAYRAWVIVAYFGVCKAIIGVMSAAAIFCSVIQPVMSICSGGHAPILFTFHSDPTVYVVVVISSCIAGGVGLVIVAALSVKSTWCVFSQPVAQQEQTPATPTQEANATSYAELEAATPV